MDNSSLSDSLECMKAKMQKEKEIRDFIEKHSKIFINNFNENHSKIIVNNFNEKQINVIVNLLLNNEELDYEEEVKRFYEANGCVLPFL